MTANRGPIPKRSEERRRRNAVSGLERSKVARRKRGPELAGEHCDPAVRWYEALRHSRQAVYFEPSDWAAAELVVLAIDAFVAKPSSVMMAAITSAMSNLLATEGDRRRLRLELEVDEQDKPAAIVSVLDEYRGALG